MCNLKQPADNERRDTKLIPHRCNDSENINKYDNTDGIGIDMKYLCPPRADDPSSKACGIRPPGADIERPQRQLQCRLVSAVFHELKSFSSLALSRLRFPRVLFWATARRRERKKTL